MRRLNDSTAARRPDAWTCAPLLASVRRTLPVRGTDVPTCDLQDAVRTPLHSPAQPAHHALLAAALAPRVRALSGQRSNYNSGLVDTRVDHYNSGLARAIGVANWDADDLQDSHGRWSHDVDAPYCIQ
jgi:hypothetical protein